MKSLNCVLAFLIVSGDFLILLMVIIFYWCTVHFTGFGTKCISLHAVLCKAPSFMRPPMQSLWWPLRTTSHLVECTLMDIPSNPISLVDLVESQVVLDCLGCLHDNRRLGNNAGITDFLAIIKPGASTCNGNCCVYLSVITESSHFFWKHDRNSGCRFLNNVCPNFAHFIYLCTLTVQNDEVSGESWQLVTVIYDEGDGLIFLNFSYKVMTIFIPGMLVLVSLELTLCLPSRWYCVIYSAIS